MCLLILNTEIKIPLHLNINYKFIGQIPPTPAHISPVCRPPHAPYELKQQTKKSKNIYIYIIMEFKHKNVQEFTFE